MLIEELGLEQKQIEALKKKKITTVESLLRHQPLHYYDFRTRYPLSLSSEKTMEFISKHRPFAVIGICTSYKMTTVNHANMITLKIEDSDTLSKLTVNIIGIDAFKQTFLNNCLKNPINIDIDIPIDIPSVYPENNKYIIKSTCAKKINYLNNLEDIPIHELISLKSGGKDGASSVKLSDIPYVEPILHKYTDNGTVALRWYARGLRLDLAIKKAISDDNRLLYKSLLNKNLLVGGFIEYNETYGFTVMNPVVVSDDILRFDNYYVQYGQIKGISADTYKNMVRKSMKYISSLDFLPTGFISRFGVPTFKEAAQMMHNPNSYLQFKKAKERFVIEDLTYFALKLEINRNNSLSNGIVLKETKDMLNYTNSLPFELTNDQKGALNKIYKKLSKGERANILVQGDVGTGKTAVAFALMFLAAASGYQAALAVPYTALASQHYKELEEVCKTLGYESAFLTSDITGKEKRKTLENIKSGNAKVIIGTHSIFSKDVEYKNLALVITDEEHKFGVIHRDNFAEKALDGFHQITMSATPIPKTIAERIYGNASEVISIAEKPAGRVPIQTAICRTDKVAMEFILQEVKASHQAYIVCPSIESKDMASIKEKAKIYGDYFKKHNVSMAVLTGKQKASEKNNILENYAQGDIDVLMSTTVIEVGINVPNATVMTITGADRFGLSTLHQLRGRIGRGKNKSYCILQTDNPNEKLEFMCHTTDGFKIANKDLEMRGPGTLFGERQSGDNYYVSLMLANPDLFTKVRLAAKELCRSNTGKDIVRRYEELFNVDV